MVLVDSHKNEGIKNKIGKLVMKCNFVIHCVPVAEMFCLFLLSFSL